MSEYECEIGLLHLEDYGRIITLSDLREHIEERKKFNQSCVNWGMPWLSHKEWTLRDYADKRKSTNLTQFDFCPKCGKKINWEEIRRADNAKEEA